MILALCLYSGCIYQMILLDSAHMHLALFLSLGLYALLHLACSSPGLIPHLWIDVSLRRSVRAHLPHHRQQQQSDKRFELWCHHLTPPPPPPQKQYQIDRSSCNSLRDLYFAMCQNIVCEKRNPINENGATEIDFQMICALCNLLLELPKPREGFVQRAFWWILTKTMKRHWKHEVCRGLGGCRLCVFYVQIQLCALLQMLHPTSISWSSPDSSLSSTLQSVNFDPFSSSPLSPDADVVVWYSPETFSWKVEGCKPPPPKPARPHGGLESTGWPSH